MEVLSLLFKIDFTQFHGLEGGVNFDIVDTNEEEFDDNLIWNMDSVKGEQKLTEANKGEQGSWVQVIDMSKAMKQPQFSDKKVGPNDPCPCGSGKKYKKCHGA